MKILLVHNYYQQPGGEDAVFADEAELLRSRGDQVIEFITDNKAIGQAPGPLQQLNLAVGTIWNQSAYRRLSECVALENPDVVHFHNTFPLTSPAGYYAARRGGAAVVQTLHNYRLICPGALLFREGQPCEQCLGRAIPLPGLVHRCYRDSLPASAAVVAMLAVHRAAGTYEHVVDAYIALTDFAREKFIAGGLPADHIRVKPNFVWPDPGPGAGAGGYALFCGRLTPEKGVLTLLSAWVHLGAAAPPLWIAGDGPLADEVRRRAAKLPGVRLLGLVERREVTRLMGDAAFLAFPSLWYEGAVAKVVLEALARGTPVLAAARGAMISLVEHGRNGLLYPPDDSAALADGVRWLLADAERTARLRQGARQTFEQRFTADENYRQLIDIYQIALARRAAAPPPPRVGAAHPPR